MRARTACAAMLVLAACAPSSDRAVESRLAAAQADFDAEKYPEAMAACERLSSQAASRPEWRCRVRLLQAKAAYYARLESVKDLLQHQCPDFPEIEIERKIVLASALVRARETAESGVLLEQARKAADARHDERLSLDARMSEARRLLYLDRAGEADRLLLEILARARKARLRAPQSAALGNLGVLRMSAVRHAEAIPFLDEAVNLTRARRNIVYFNSLNNLGICYARLGEFDLAIRHQSEAVAGFESKGYRIGLIEALGGLGASYYQQGALDKSAEYVERAYQLAKPAGGENAARLAFNLATLHAERGDWARAADLNAEAQRLNRQLGLAATAHDTLLEAQIAEGRGERAQAARLYRQALGTGSNPVVAWPARMGLAQIAWNAKDTAGARSEFEAAIGEVERSRAELEKTDLRLSYFGRLIEFYQKYVDFLMQQGEPAAALEVAESSRAKVLLERTGGSGAKRLPAAAFQRLAAASKAVILSYWLAPQASYLWVITPAAIHTVPLPPRDQIAGWVDQYSGVIRNQADPAATRFEAGDKLYSALVAPAAKWLPPGTRVILVPDQALYGLSFDTLPVYRADGAHYWIEDVELTVAPSLAASLSRQASGNPRLLLIGDPVSDNPAFPRLAHAVREVDRIAAGFPENARTVKTGEQATPAAFLASEPQSATYVHFTSHAIANRQTPLDSAIVLTGGMLYARDLMKLRLNAEMVAVSACRGAGGRAYVGEGLVGFAWAFLRAGARRVVAGLWDVDDEATAEMMGALYDRIRKGKAPSAALREAKLGLLRGGRYAKPYFWGPFQLYAAVQ